MKIFVIITFISSTVIGVIKVYCKTIVVSKILDLIKSVDSVILINNGNLLIVRNIVHLLFRHSEYGFIDHSTYLLYSVMTNDEIRWMYRRFYVASHNGGGKYIKISK